MKRVLLLTLAGLLLAAGCIKVPLVEPVTTAEAVTTERTTTLEEAYEKWSQEHKETLERPLPIDDSYYYWDPRMPHLIAQDAENDAYLYGFNNAGFGGSGALLLYKGFPCYLDWEYYVMQYSFPDMMVADFDGCGRSEIAMCISIGKGVGWHPGRLTIVVPKPLADRNFSSKPPSWEYYSHLGFDVHYFDAADMRKQIDKVITRQEIRGEDEFLLRFSDGKKTITGPPPMMASFEEHVNFSFEKNGSIRMSAIAGRNCQVTADVQFEDGTFTLKNIALENLE